MPIYAYRCNECGFSQDVLQKVSDPVLTVCPSCGKPEFKKQVTAAGFQLKGSGWYVTDFKSSANAASSSASDSGNSTDSATSSADSSNTPSTKKTTSGTPSTSSTTQKS